MKKYCFGIDVGGTFIKGAVVDSDGNIIASSKIPTECEMGESHVSSNIKILCDKLLELRNRHCTGLFGIGTAV